MRQRILVAMSGGVDSSTAAWLLQQEGCDLVGAMLKMFDAERPDAPAGGACRSPDDTEDARMIARKLGFPFYVFNACDDFRTHVIDRFISAYEAGLTPNPCVECNRYLKFGLLLRRAQELGCDGLATGHYARLAYDSGSGRWLLKKAVHPEKDQSYVLASLTQEQLSHARFPLGTLTKDEVRELARQAGLVNAHKGDSQDICFIPDGDYAAFICRRTGRTPSPGPFLDEDGTPLGCHKGLIHYTVGQRRGLGVSSARGALYVKALDPSRNAVVLSTHEGIFSRSLTASGLNLIACDRLDRPTRLRAKVRYRMAEQPCTVEQTGPTSIRLTFDQPQRAITPGQTVVLYDGDTVVGGAAITRGE